MHPNGAFFDAVGGPVYADGTTPRAVKIRADQFASVRGFGWTSGAEEIVKEIDANATGSTRIDRVALELNRSTWNVRAVIVPGTAGAGAPDLNRNEGPSGVFQVPLARVTVPSGAASISSAQVYVDGHRVGSRVRTWVNAADMLFPKMGEIGFDYTTRNWFGWNGTQRMNISSDTGWVNLSLNGSNGDAWNSAGANRIRAINGVAYLQVNVTRWATNGLGLSDEDGSTPFVLPAGFRPAVGPVTGHGNHARNSVMLYIYPNGDVRIYPLNQDMPANRRVYADATFPIG